ncbi:anti-sigma factor [Pseudanabaenaceae cyanobacterium LEGE 13415]|nr:anti-sigma factor [Pseudanabaenaceae cyanobacterium LEGE 13415]
MTRANDDPNPTDLAAGYILDDLSPEEVDRLDQALAESSTIAQEITSFQEAFALLPYDTPMVEPSPRLKQKILSAAIQSAAKPPNVVPLASRNWKRWVPAISTGIAAVAVAALGQLAQQSQQTIALQRQLEATNTEIAQLRSELQTNRETIARLSQPDTQVYSLVSATSNRATARVLANKSDRTVTLVAQDLPKLSNNQIYRLWAVSASSSAPTYCGQFRQDDTGKAQWVAPNAICTKTPSRLLITLDAPSDPITSAGPLVMKSSS